VQVKDVLLSESSGGKDMRMSGTNAMQCASSGIRLRDGMLAG
jgi:hypothetical protein